MQQPTLRRRVPVSLLAVITVLAALAWFVSAWWGIALMDLGWRWSPSLTRGQLRLYFRTYPVDQRNIDVMTDNPATLGRLGPLWLGAVDRRPIPRWEMLPEHDHARTGTRIDLPVWPLPILTGAAWFLLRPKRQRPLGACAACGYDRSTIPASAPCPECGRLTATPESQNVIADPRRAL
ncbi:MAG TPA: hypothetical protein VD997_10645 [Phycisphaerales bacterium]|nr:hypothetical protein [Phycisphaerales bacterium]